MYSTKFTKTLAAIVTDNTGIPCYCDADLDTFQGEQNEIYVLHQDACTELVAANNTHRIDYNLAYVVQPETMDNDEMLDRVTGAYHKMREYFLNLPRYTQYDGAYFLQYYDGQMQLVPDGSKSTISWQFALVVHFD